MTNKEANKKVQILFNNYKRQSEADNRKQLYDILLIGGLMPVLTKDNILKLVRLYNKFKPISALKFLSKFN